MDIDWKKLFDIFVGKDHYPFREWLTKPFINTAHNNEVWATDGHALLMVSEGVCPDDGYDRLEKRLGWLPCKDVKPIAKFSLQTLRDALAKCPQEETMEDDEEIVECPECKGTGYVKWSYMAHRGKKFFYKEEFECPVCEGSGHIDEGEPTPTGKYELSYYAAIRILGNTLRAGEMKRLVDAAELIGTDTTTVLYKQCCNPGFIQDGVVFGMADGIRLAVMPFLPKEVDPIVDMEVESA